MSSVYTFVLAIAFSVSNYSERSIRFLALDGREKNDILKNRPIHGYIKQ